MRRLLSAVIALALSGAAACSGDDDSAPKPDPDPDVSTTVIDRSGILLAGVDGQTTTTIVERGTATLTGSVTGPDGLVAGATVRIERLVAGREIRTDVLTGPDGRFSVADAPGGRYRVRAFLAPTLVQLAPVVRFLEDGKEHTFDLVLEQQSGLVVRSDAAPDPPLLDGPVNVVVALFNRSVDADGVVRYVAVTGVTVELVGMGRWELRDDSEPPDDEDDDTTTSSTTSTSEPFSTTASTTTTTPGSRPSPVARTDSSGRVRYEMRCVATGSPGLSLRVPVTVRSAPDASGAPGPTRTTTQTVALELPDCVDPTTLTTTTAAPPSTTQP
ncbi:MAG: carboxypeptidase-like regulatory domain-containing protein [Actinomycetota bacterium]